tara:strand:+ start:79 stop:660 length:582 start_codon:yes stop_codon:yes gene_type:complete
MKINYSSVLDIIINLLIPLTEKSIKKGNKIFGAVIINKKNYSIEAIGTNNEIDNPLFHGEISAINDFFCKKNTSEIKDCIFLSSHEPCSLCLSAITWSGFDNFLYFFPYEDTKSKFNIPHDLNILREVFNIDNGKYNESNNYWKSYSILSEIKKLPILEQKKLDKKIKLIFNKYNNFSKIYQSSKKINKIHLN